MRVWGSGPDFLAFWDRSESGLEGDQRLSARWLLAQPWGEDLARRGPAIVCGKTESNLKSILGWSQFCLWGGKSIPLLDLSVEAIREITGPFLIPDSVQCLFRRGEDSAWEPGLLGRTQSAVV